MRRVIELVLGVALGVFVGDVLVGVTGHGLWQLALIVSVSMIVAIVLGGGPTLTLQAGATGIIIATVTPVSDLLFSRVFDVLIGAAVGIAVSTVLLPLNPMVVTRRAAGRVLTDLARALADLGEALRIRSDASVQSAAERVRAVEAPLSEFTRTIGIAAETARLAPFRWRSRGRVQPYLLLAERMHHVVRNLRVLTRRSRSLLGQEEPVPPGVPDALDGLAGAVRLLLGDLLAERDPERARTELRQAARMTADVPGGMTISAQVIVAQVRSTTVDLLRACGLSYADADRVVRSAATEPRLRPGPSL
ncbi:MAG TPA: FUSC family protein, partial [Mycobacteriales bacterium]|nr:FUSC family protein [Mycobacteriales bacterium]